MIKFIRRRQTVRQLVALSVAALLLSTSAVARQATQKRPLTHADYDGWRAIQGQQLSRDGKYVAYALVPQDGDGEMVARNLETGKEWRYPRGAQPTLAPPQNPGGEPFAGPPPFAGRPFFTADSRFIAFQILPAKAEVEKAKKDKKKPEDMPKNALGIMNLATGEVAR
ncbi:MAG TPA: hypothetical protein VJZ26_17555, partial [Blastocatellia bacterium]|nr:hypothetical protein [Blastocatellia bacterium]